MKAKQPSIPCPACGQQIPDADFCDLCGYQLNPNLSLPQVAAHHIATGTTQMLKKTQQIAVASAKKVTTTIKNTRNGGVTIKYLIYSVLFMIAVGFLMEMVMVAIFQDVKFYNAIPSAFAHVSVTRKFNKPWEAALLTALFVMCTVVGGIAGLLLLNAFGIS